MERGYIKIEENGQQEFVVEAKLIDGNLWLSKHEMADLFNVFVNTIGNNLRAIFKSGILREDNVTRIHTFEHEGRQCETTLYNLEALIFVSYRIASFEARAFREWVMKALTEYMREDKTQKQAVLVIYNLGKDLPSVVSMN
jgi:hypothetical protein